MGISSLNNNSALDILEENAKIMTEKNEEIEKENKDAEIKEKKQEFKKVTLQRPDTAVLHKFLYTFKVVYKD